MNVLSLEELARQLRVSRRTVSRVLSGGKNVAPEVRLRVERFLAKSNYVPNVQAARLASRRVPILGLVFPTHFLNTLDDYVARVIKGALRAAQTLDHQVTLLPFDRMDAPSIERMFRSRLVGEFVFVAFGPQDGAELRKLRQQGVPLAVVNFRTPGVDSYDCDNTAGGRLATEHLLATGRRRIAFLHGRDEWITARERREGYVQALTNAGVSVDPQRVIEAHFEPGAAARAIDKLLAQSPRPDAVFAANDIMMFAAYGALRQHGVRVPEDVGLIGFDDTPVCGMPLLETTLSSVSQPLEDIAQAAAQRAIALSEGTASPGIEHQLFPPLLKPRESTTQRDPARPHGTSEF